MFRGNGGARGEGVTVPVGCVYSRTYIGVAVIPVRVQTWRSAGLLYGRVLQRLDLRKAFLVIRIQPVSMQHSSAGQLRAKARTRCRGHQRAQGVLGYRMCLVLKVWTSKIR